MQGNKALYLQNLCMDAGWQYTRFDYQGHGESSGKLADGGISTWAADALAVLDTVCVGPQIVVGSSMGGWIATLLSEQRPSKVAGLLGIASAPDFTEELIWNNLDANTRTALEEGGSWHRPNRYQPESPHPVTMAFIDSGRQCRVLDKALAWNGPVRLLHGLNDVDVPASLSQRLLERLNSDDARLVLVKQADHRFSSAAELALVGQQIRELREICSG